jgi:hypothetical protein
MQAIMLKLLTHAQQFLVLVVTARCAACATLECVTALEKRPQVEKFDRFLLPQYFLP